MKKNLGDDFHIKADELLTAFDKVANSNSILLKAPAKPGDLKRRFLYFVPSRAFKRLMCESDRVRNWHNMHRMNEAAEWVPKRGGFYTGAHIEFAKTMNEAAFARRLKYLLTSGPCFYGKRYPKKDVSRIVREFLKSFPVDDDQVLYVKPDFLFSHDYLGYGTPAPKNGLCYFDGCGCDHCWTWLSDGDLLVLLLNGSS